MKVESYCNAMQSELAAWKAKVYDVVRAFDKMSSGEKEKVSGQVNDLHIIIEELEEKINRLNKECPDVWSEEKKSIDTNINDLGFKWQKVWGTVAGGDFGG